MCSLLDQLKDYFKSTPRSQIESDWNKTSEYDEIGLSVDELVNIKTITMIEQFEYVTCSVFMSRTYSGRFYWDIKELQKLGQDGWEIISELSHINRSKTFLLKKKIVHKDK
ncbi:hypothetical protein [Dysgonomonas massiliensis]|uniref:hypothetical protein n=1 Tax=Dysgonomonas massiliensis TaxID=2040292 RepID=UPI000C779F99|nr:hypothetical protein [Dysgonomonas massiliensis]